jgi:beta-N-acetylhexosaminidase
MKLRLPGRADAPSEGLPSRFDLPEFTWTELPPKEPLAPPPPPSPPPHRRRRVVALLLLALVVGAAGAGTALLVSRGEKPLSQRDKAQLEAAAPGSSKQGRKASLAVPRVVKRTAAGLPLPRAVAQLFVVGTTAQYPGDAFFGRLRGRAWGAVVIGPGNVVDEGQAAALTGEMSVVARKARHLVPLVAAQQAGGPASAFPDVPPRAQPLAGDAGGPARARADARAAARALRRLGVRMTLAPVADVGIAAGPVEDQVFADDARVVTRLTAAAVDGYRRGRVIAAVGHFPGEGSASEDPDVANATVGFSLAELRRRDLRPFAAVARRAPVIQMSNAVYAAWDGVTPATVLPDAVGRLLRGDLRYRGVVMTPDLTSTAPVLGVGVGTAAVQALEAGADFLYVSGGPAQQEAAYRAVLRAVRKGRISRERLRLSLQRVLALKRRYGLPVAVQRRVARRKARKAAVPRRQSRPGGNDGQGTTAGRPRPRP